MAVKWILRILLIAFIFLVVLQILGISGWVALSIYAAILTLGFYLSTRTKEKQ